MFVCEQLGLLALACCENIPTPMDDVMIVKAAVVAAIASSIRVFILYINLDLDDGSR